jgi:hypothetical protein
MKFHEKIILVGAEFFLSDRQTDRPEEADSRFSQFCKVPKKKEKKTKEILPACQHRHWFVSPSYLCISFNFLIKEIQCNKTS